MVKVEWRVSVLPTRLKMKILDKLEMFRLTYMSLCYNHFTSWNTVIDTAFEPLFWIVDHTARFLGPIMVTLVVFLVTLVVATVYVCILPHIYYQSDLTWVIVHIIFGHWLLINMIFHYFMAAFTKPGHPPQAVDEVVSICKKCISPKPPRTHHCTVCGACILKMDHHCPWLNNCVGFHNHRYFFQFVAFMWLGSVYVSIAGYDVFKQHFFGNRELIVPAFFFPINLAYHALTHYQENKPSSNASHTNTSHLDGTNLTDDLDADNIKVSMEGQFLHNLIIIEFLLAAGVSVALGLLGSWHAILISTGQTSIEYHINKKERSRLKKKNMVFRNPYYFGIWDNWKVFLGLRRGRSFFRHILFPSRHDPEGNGITWRTATFSLEKRSYLELL